MRPIWECDVIQIDVADGACPLKCSHCTRGVGLRRDPSFMSLDMIRRAIGSLEGFEGQIGCMGGEPLAHPQFPEVLAAWRDMVPRGRRSLWTSGFKWKEYEDDIYATFDRDMIHYNDHSQTTGKHQPILVAIEETVDDPELRKVLIDNCPYQARWSASITPRGAFFCEIAGTIAAIYDQPGYPVENGWWRKAPSEFKDQVDRFCGRCSGAIPMPSFSDGRGGRDGPAIEYVSPKNFNRLAENRAPKVRQGHVRIWEGKFTIEEIMSRAQDWNPRQFRPFEAHAPEDYLTGVKDSVRA